MSEFLDEPADLADLRRLPHKTRGAVGIGTLHGVTDLIIQNPREPRRRILWRRARCEFAGPKRWRHLAWTRAPPARATNPESPRARSAGHGRISPPSRGAAARHCHGCGKRPP